MKRLLRWLIPDRALQLGALRPLALEVIVECIELLFDIGAMPGMHNMAASPPPFDLTPTVDLIDHQTAWHD